MKNPKVKVGDKIRILNAMNGQNALDISETWIVTKVHNNGNIVASSGVNGRVANFFETSPSDTWVLADRKNIIKYHHQRIKDCRQQIKESEQEIDFLTKYEDEAEFVADKIDQLLKTDGVKAKAKILRELKKTQYI